MFSFQEDDSPLDTAFWCLLHWRVIVEAFYLYSFNIQLNPTKFFHFIVTETLTFP